MSTNEISDTGSFTLLIVKVRQSVCVPPKRYDVTESGFPQSFGIRRHWMQDCVLQVNVWFPCLNVPTHVMQTFPVALVAVVWIFRLIGFNIVQAVLKLSVPLVVPLMLAGVVERMLHIAEETEFTTPPVTV